MAKKALDDFMGKWGKYEGARNLVNEYRKDPSNPNLYDAIIIKTFEETGELRELIDKRTGKVKEIVDERTGERKELSERTIRRFLQAIYSSARGKAVESANSNLESLLTGLDEKVLQGLVLQIKPAIEGKEYDEITKLHKEVAKMKIVLNDYMKSEEPEQKKAALQEVYSSVPELINKRLKERGLSDEDIKIWENALIKSAYVNSGYALSLYKESAIEKANELLEKLSKKGRILDYIKSNLDKAKDEEKEEVFRMIHAVNQRNKEK